MAQTGFTPEDEAFLSRSACQLYQRCAFGRFAEELLEDALTCGAPGERTVQRLHHFLEQYTDLLEQEYGWC